MDVESRRSQLCTCVHNAKSSKEGWVHVVRGERREGGARGEKELFATTLPGERKNYKLSDSLSHLSKLDMKFSTDGVPTSIWFSAGQRNGYDSTIAQSRHRIVLSPFFIEGVVSRTLTSKNQFRSDHHSRSQPNATGEKKKKERKFLQESSERSSINCYCGTEDQRIPRSLLSRTEEAASTSQHRGRWEKKKKVEPKSSPGPRHKKTRQNTLHASDTTNFLK